MSTAEIKQQCIYDKQMIIALLTEHWEEFMSILNGNYTGQEADTFPPSFNEFARLLAHSLKKAQHTNQPNSYQQTTAYSFLAKHDPLNDIAIQKVGLLQKASCMHEQTDPESNLHNTIINDNGIFIIQRENSYDSLDAAFQNLVDSVLS